MPFLPCASAAGSSCPAVAVDRLAAEAVESGGCVDVAKLAADRRAAREITRRSGGASW